MSFTASGWVVAGLLLCAGAFWRFLNQALSTRRSQQLVVQRDTSQVQSRLLAVLNGSPDAIIGMRSDNSIVFWNRAAERLFGMTGDDVLGLSSQELLQALSGEQNVASRLDDLRASLMPRADGGLAPLVEVTLQRRDGTPLIVELSVSRHADDAGWTSTAYIRDIGTHKQSQQLLEATKRQLLDVTDNLPVAVYQFRMTEGKAFYPFANYYWNNMGLPPEVVTSDPRRVFMLCHEDDLPAVQSSIRKAVITGEVWTMEMRIRFPDGNYRWMLGVSKPIPHPEGGVIFNGYWQDIHEAKLQALAVKEAQVAAETARRQLLDMTDGLPLSVFQFWLNHSGRIEFLFVGANCRKVIGVAADDILHDATRCWSSVFEEDRLSAQQALQEAIQSRKPFNMEHRISAHDAVRWIRTHALPAQLESGIQVWNGFWMDETEARSNMDELRRSMELAEDATRTKSTFLATMSHEIRTPMNAIIGMSHLAMQYGMDTKARSFVEKVNRAGNNLLGIINDILDFSKIEADKLDMEQVDFVLDDVMDNVRNLLSMKAEESGLQLRFHVPASLPPVLIGDPLRLGQILINLGNNAVKFTEHGFIDVGVQLHAVRDQEVDLDFSVRDSGIGMTQEQCSRLFQAFSQADGSTTRKYGGTGLGLAISKRLVELMGGDIRVESTPGVGSAFLFRVTLGVSDNKVLAQNVGRLDRSGVRAGGVGAAGVEADARTKLRGVRLLLVEDNEMNQELAMELLGGAGVEVTLAVHGAHALEILGTGQEFDGVLMDCQMPVMDGYTATRQLRQNPAWATLPVIAMTANVMASDLERAMAAGMNAHVAKPLNVGEMFSIIAHWVKPREGLVLPVLDTANVSTELESHFTELPLLSGIDTQKGLTYTNYNHGLYRRQLLTFLRNQQDFMPRFEAAVSTQDWDTATRHAHTLKGTSGGIGAVALQQASTKLEQRCLSGVTGQALLQECALVEPYLQEVLESLRTLEAPESSQVAGTAQSLDAVKALLQQLEAMCEDSNPDAAELGSVLLKGCAGQPYESTVRQLDKALNDFDFDEAQQIFKELHQQLDPAQGAQRAPGG